MQEGRVAYQLIPELEIGERGWRKRLCHFKKTASYKQHQSRGIRLSLGKRSHKIPQICGSIVTWRVWSTTLVNLINVVSQKWKMNQVLKRLGVQNWAKCRVSRDILCRLFIESIDHHDIRCFRQSTRSLRNNVVEAKASRHEDCAIVA